MLNPGARLGPYEVTGSLGKGGMGEVHRARDERLGRDVALKVLPDDVASDRDRMARFEREARLLAALNHPHIAAIYGLEDAGSTRALVMELAEGPTLQERIAEGPMPVDEALDLARQMAEALEYAHERGIVHRDLKPANVKVTPEGEVKLLDFGLAKAFEAEGTEPNGDYSESPTISPQATRAGVILGTASYMSPEQARGKAVDRRTDIWAFGVVLLEMLTGRSTFTGESLTDVLAAVVSSEPDLGALPSGTPPAVRRLLRRCLDKDTKHRLRDIGEARILLEDPAPPRHRRLDQHSPCLAGRASRGVPRPPQSRRRRRRRHRRGPGGAQPRSRRGRPQRGIAWTPSGEEVVHLGTDNSLWATRLSGLSRRLFQTLGDAAIQDVAADGRILLTDKMMRRELVGRGPGDTVERNLSWGDWSFPSFLSSDGRTVLFDEARIVTDGDYGLFLRPTDGSPPVRLGDGLPFALSPDGRWALAASQGGGTVQLWLLPTGAGQARRLFSLDAVPSAAGFLPDGERLVFLASVAGEGRRLYVHDLSGGSPRAISPEGVTASVRRLFFPDGRFALAHSPEGLLTLYPIDEGEGEGEGDDEGEGEPLVVPGTSAEDMPVGWHQDGRTLFVQRPTGLPAEIEEVNIETGERRLWKELTPPDPAGVSVIFPIHVSADGRAYVYSYRRVLDRLTVVDGLL